MNPRQEAAVKYIDNPLLVLAGAGSGKTRVITHKIAYLIDQCGIAAHHIAALTFTNKAAQEMKERVRQTLTGKSMRGLSVSTFHHLGLRMIRHERKHLNLKSGFSIFDTRDSKALMAELMLKGNVQEDQSLELIQRQISTWKNNLTTPSAAVSCAENDQQHLAAMLYEEYDRHLRIYNAVDFDDLIVLPSMLLRTHSDIRERWQNRIRYLLVDEYQDTNASQYLLVKLLVGARAALTVVGDDDQSIYAWRGAQPENLALLKKKISHS